MKIAESEIKQNKIYLDKGIRTALKVENGDVVEFHVNAPREGEIVISIVKKEAK